MNVWAFNGARKEDAKQQVYQSIKNGKSRFGWSGEEENNLTVKGNVPGVNGKQLFLLNIAKGDWIVHINTPEWGKCVAVKTTKEYGFDEGLNCEWGIDFRHFIEIDKDSIIEFKRRDKNIIPSVNLCPRSRYHRVHEVHDFIQSINNLKNNKHNSDADQNHHLKDKTDKYLNELTVLIQKMNASKTLESFLADVFEKIPGVVNVDRNGLRGGTDHGADLIVETNTPIGNLDINNKIVVQIKSFKGEHKDLNAVEQIESAKKKYDATEGLIITTAERTKELEDKIQEVSEDLKFNIGLMAGDDVARFVLKYAPDLLFRI